MSLEPERDDQDHDQQSDMTGTMSPRSTMTISSSGMDAFFREDEAGRRYHATENPYSLPSDDDEIARLDVQHLIHQKLLGDRNYHPKAPVLDVLMNFSATRKRRILDVGTGSGIWAIEMALEFPTCDVTGMDMVPIQPFDVPPNVTFEIDDLNKPWMTRENERYDLLHSRFVSYGVKSWPDYISGAVSAIAPGGLGLFCEIWEWFEIPDEKSVPNLRRLGDLLRRLVEGKGATALGGRKLLPLLQEHPDLYDVQYEVVKWPFGPSRTDPVANQAGTWFAKDIEYAVPLVKPLLIEDNHNEAYIAHFLSQARQEMWDDNKTAYMTMVYAWARKKPAPSV